MVASEGLRYHRCMPMLVANGAQMVCTFGAAPSNLVVVPRHHGADQMQLAHVDDHQPMLNILPFAVCVSPSNPACITPAGLVPAPCIPMTNSPWAPGSQFLVENVGKREVPALLSTDTCQCQWAGQIMIVDPATTINIDG